MEEFKENFYKTYKKFDISNETDANKILDGKRKQLALKYSLALKTLDNMDTCHLLEFGLIDYFQTQDNSKRGNGGHSIEKQIPISRSTLLENLDLEALRKSLPSNCTASAGPSSVCTQSNNNIPNSAIQHFKRAFLESETKPLIQSLCVKPEASTSSIKPSYVEFKTAREELECQNAKKFGGTTTMVKSSSASHLINNNNNGGRKRKLGMRRNVHSKFVPPLLTGKESASVEEIPTSGDWPMTDDERLRNFDVKMVEMIRAEIMDVCGGTSTSITWDDIVGLEYAKSAIQEAIVWPLLRPDIFTGLRRPPKGVLLFGPPGTGKTLIGKCVAAQSNSTFFSISAASLTSKWIGEGEKMVRTLFAVARCHQPSVIFIDEIDSLLTQRSDTEHESSRRLKTEFFIQLDGVNTVSDDRVVVVAATNRPDELDEAARRRFVRRLYVPLPDCEARVKLIGKLINNTDHNTKTMDLDEIQEIARLTDGYSGADITNLCSEASLELFRTIDMTTIQQIQPDQLRSVTMDDFRKALTRIKSSVNSEQLENYVTWDKTFGSGK